MVSIYDVKPRFQALLRPLTNSLARVGITANQVTITAVLLSFGAGGLIALGREIPQVLFVLPAVMLVRMALNAIDGMLAREHGQKSHLGAILNELGDVFSDAALYLPLALVPGFCPYLVVTLVVLAVISEMTGVVAIQIGATRRYDGPMGKSDRAFSLGTIAFVIAAGVPTGRWLDVLLGVIVLLLLVTIVNRARNALRDASSLDAAPPL